jgi:hypothetical protein
MKAVSHPKRYMRAVVHNLHYVPVFFLERAPSAYVKEEFSLFYETRWVSACLALNITSWTMDSTTVDILLVRPVCDNFKLHFFSLLFKLIFG